MTCVCRMLVPWLAALLLLASPVEARTLRWARSGDALTLDPHAQSEGPTFALNHQIYEPLLIRDHVGKIMPALAESWALTSDPTIWEFALRKGVTFHDGAPFTAADVAFSFDRANQPSSDMKAVLEPIERVIPIDEYKVQIKTKAPYPLLPGDLTNLFIMSRAWAESNNAVKPQDFKNKEESFAARNANGTGPYRVLVREPDVKTVLRRHDGYWGKSALDLPISEIVYTPIKSDPTRVAALLSGEVDFVQDMPLQDIERLRSTPGFRVVLGPENRSIFLGMNVGDQELRSSDVKGKNPLSDVRVRKAINMAVDRETLQRVVMRGHSLPTGTIAPPGINGWTQEWATYPKHDTGAAARLMSDAGFSDGFSIQLNCPNDRYLNDEAICQALAGQLARIGIKVNLMIQSKSLHFPAIQKDQADFYLLGWNVPTFDSQFIFSYLYHTKIGKLGGWNSLRLSDPTLDAKISDLNRETDSRARNLRIAEIWSYLQDQAFYIPLHIQTLAYGMKEDFEIDVDISNTPKIKSVRLTTK